jgi:hypothetical protein
MLSGIQAGLSQRNMTGHQNSSRLSKLIDTGDYSLRKNAEV